MFFFVVMLMGHVLLGFKLAQTLQFPFAFAPFFFWYALMFVNLWLLQTFMEKSSLKLSGGTLLFLTAFLDFLFLSPFPVLSTDVYRYLWDGQVLAGGFHPWEYSPVHPTLQSIRNVFPLPPDHQNVSSVYPPLAEAYFFGLSSLSSQPWVFSLAGACLHVLSVGLLVHRFQTKPKHLSKIIWFAAHPLILIEAVHEMHVDMLGVCLLVCALLYGRIRTLFLVCAAWVKLWPAGMLLFDKKRILGLSIFALGMYVFWALASFHSGLPIYLKDWEFNSPIFSCMKFFSDGYRARYLIYALMGVFSFWLMLNREKLNFARAVYFFLGMFYLLNPTVYPWYVLWLLPLGVFTPVHVEWRVFTLFMPLSYFVLTRYFREGVWDLPWWISLGVYLPVIVGIFFRAIRGKFKFDFKPQ